MAATDDFLHGVEVVEIDDGPRPITTIRSAVIGLIGTAPDSEDATTATLTTGAEADDNGLLWTAVAEGAPGNNIGIYLKAIEAGADLAVSVLRQLITVTLETSADGDILSTAGEVLAAVNAHDAASELVTVSAVGTSDGLGLARATYGIQYLTGGLNEAFPLNTPVLVAGRRTDAARLGMAGTLARAIDAIFDQIGAWVIVVRVAEDVDEAVTRSNVMGGPINHTGLHAFLDAESITHVAPRLLIAPGFSQEAAVAAELESIASQLFGIAIVDGPNTTDQDALDYRQKFGSERIYLIDPRVQIWDTQTNGYRYEASSARVAGMFAENDIRRGWHTSPSNRPMRGITGLARPIDFELSNPNARSNMLNGGNVNTIVQKDGYRLWGNHTTSADPKWRFVSVRRTADMIHEALLRSHLWAVDRNITRTYLEDVTASVQRWLDQQTRLEHIAGGRIWGDRELNTIESLASGRVYFDVEFTAFPPAERITFRSHLTNKYLADIFPDAAAA